MVTRPTATGSVGGSPPRRRVMAKKTPVAKANAAIHSNAAAKRSGSRPIAASLQFAFEDFEQRFDGRVVRVRADPVEGIAEVRPESRGLPKKIRALLPSCEDRQPRHP